MWLIKINWNKKYLSIFINMDILYFILISYGITQTLTYGHILDRIRPQGRFFHCSMCIGFWVGMAVHSISGYTSLLNYECNIIDTLLMGCVSSGTSYALSTIFKD